MIGWGRRRIRWSWWWKGSSEWRLVLLKLKDLVDLLLKLIDLKILIMDLLSLNF
jgi:hypothetical protein